MGARRANHVPELFLKASFRFSEDLSRFLRPEYRGRRFVYSCARAANLKNAIEALGVPHTEVGELLVNGAPATLQRTVREGDDIEVRAPAARADGPLNFIADAHLGALGPWATGLAYDLSGSYAPGFAAALGCCVLSAIAIWVIRRRD